MSVAGNGTADTWSPLDTPAPDTRQAFRQALDIVTAKAQAALPDNATRIEGALKLVLAGDVELLGDGTARVASASNGTTTYHIVNGHCDCKDYPRAPQNFCKHRLAHGLLKRTVALVRAQLDAAPTAPAAPVPEAQVWRSNVTPGPLPEAPCSANCHITVQGRQVQLTLRDTDETRLLQRLDAVLQRFPMEQPPALASSPPIHSCTLHGPMKESSKRPGTWYCPAKLSDGSYCQATA